MIFFYWLVAVMTLDQHWLWGRVILDNSRLLSYSASYAFLLLSSSWWSATRL